MICDFSNMLCWPFGDRYALPRMELINSATIWRRTTRKAAMAVENPTPVSEYAGMLTASRCLTGQAAATSIRVDKR
jgi:hypothetical protein